jgi:serine/threonine-protein kinase
MNSDAMALFRELADRSPTEREEYYVRQRVPPALRAEVESLLRFDSDTVGAIHERVAAAARIALGHLDPATHTAVAQSDGDSLVSEIGEGRFAPGTLMAGRYRIVSLVGRGGMGEVYRASDIKLKQPVALKFLPAAASRDPGLLARFHSEVRLARQISHPNVCRVYDIGEVDGAAYISMEYIDGDDLATLLRRIGRLPYDKAIEIARRLCAGLAAAHDKGVVHRDLKPGNVMIDSRGQVFITDFGLAATARDLQHTQLRSGTPAYMAPEQLEGRHVSVQSDLYALGLVLYEMFTGRPPFTTPRTPADRPPRIESVAKDVNLAVVRAIERCIELEPRDRPSSALAVAASLPGGNPLAEALAAGVTPSPQMVAAARVSEALSVRAAVMAFALVLIGLPASIAFGSRVSVLHITPFPLAPEVLAQKSREIIDVLGYTASPLDRDWSFFWNGFYQSYAEHLPLAEYRAQLARGQPALVSFRYRQSGQYLMFFDPAKDYIDEGDPPLRGPGDVFLSLDLHGRLRHLEVVPPADSYSQRVDWPVDRDRLFAMAGIDPTRFAPAEPNWIPPVTFDTRVAWTGTFAHSPSAAIRVEAASWRGRPVYFRVTDEALQSTLQLWYGPLALAGWVYLVAPWIVWAGAGLVAWRNHKAGRTDLRGASRLGAAVFGCSLIGWGLTAHHVPTPEYLPSVFRALSAALTIGVLGAVLYMAVEPFIRRWWPESLISWTRLLSGRIRDPLVGGHILVGLAFGIGLALWSMLKMATLLNQGLVTTQDWRMLNGLGSTLSSMLWNLVSWSVMKTLAICVLFLFTKVLLHRDWMAIVAVVFLANAITIAAGPQPLMQIVFEVPSAAVAVWLLIRWGVLPMMVALFVAEVMIYTPLTGDLTAWYAGPTLFVLATALTLAVWSFSIALAGRPVFEDEWLERSG